MVENDRRTPGYVLRLLEYYIRMEKMIKDKETDKTDEEVVPLSRCKNFTLNGGIGREIYEVLYFYF